MDSFSNALYFHFFSTVIALGIGLIVGGGIGTGIAFGCRQLINTHPKVRRVLMLLPTRSFLALPITILFSSATLWLMPMEFPLTMTIPAMVGFGLLAIGLVSASWLSAWYPLPVPTRMAATTRNLTILALTVLPIVGQSLSWGILHEAMRQFMISFDAQVSWPYFGIIGVSLLVMDLFFGVVQYCSFSVKHQQSSAPSPTP